MALVVLDPGHGGKDPGAIGRLGEQEASLAYDIALAAKDHLYHLGHETLLTRGRDEGLGLGERANIANRRRSDCFVSIHLNSAVNAEAHGFEAYSCPGSMKGEELRDSILLEIAKEFPDWKNRGGKTAQYVVLRYTKMPATLVECGFLSHPEEEKRLLNREVRNRMGRAIALGIHSFVKGVQRCTR